MCLTSYLCKERKVLGVRPRLNNLHPFDTEESCQQSCLKNHHSKKSFSSAQFPVPSSGLMDPSALPCVVLHFPVEPCQSVSQLVENPEGHSETKGSVLLLEKERRFKDKGLRGAVILYEHKERQEITAFKRKRQQAFSLLQPLFSHKEFLCDVEPGEIPHGFAHRPSDTFGK
ncbi:uncharacterized protein ACIQIH_002499 [Cyanocitta cristata]